MIIEKNTFKNTGDLMYNDVVKSGHPYILEGYEYRFEINPKCKYWRQGIRLSKTPKIKFFHPDHRYRNTESENNYIDIHLSVGDFNNPGWSASERLQVCQYNIPEEEHILENMAPYHENESVNWSFSMDGMIGEFRMSITTQHSTIQRKLTINNEFKYFKVFAWADNSSFEIDCDIIIKPNLDYNSNEIIVGNLTFRNGDMFDLAVIKKRILSYFQLLQSEQLTLIH
ncbi:hypothetical protein [Flavihumibacter sp. CACIAM 22H1]|uniref:hypothetical protein n=1 Tax=Flavihumibacter sp. CACIAM 22H1 TaxID=1812911 RepID=UPI0007A8AE3A|nr:hypothetical protein [Flavihumibacter sp. CACIAM 22H1]KYP16169.1 MAG: hypothetical protein A1D16_13980 [Flavihumibacter sp. CACIAM 22H1]